MLVKTRQGIPSQQRRKFIKQKGQCCAYCQATENLTVDHKPARALGGTNDRGNLQVLCRPCNWRKAAEETQLLALLQTTEGRAELLRQWAEQVAANAARARLKQAQRLAQRQEALLLIEANRRAGKYEGMPQADSETGNSLS